MFTKAKIRILELDLKEQQRRINRLEQKFECLRGKHEWTWDAGGKCCKHCPVFVEMVEKKDE